LFVRTTLVSGLLAVTALICLPAAHAQQPGATASLDYDYFKTKVEPIFLAKRPGHARCIACHGSGTPLRFQPLAPGATTWSEEESRKNFESTTVLVVPGNLEKSRLLIHPLAEDAGGDFFHTGGKQFDSQSSPEWQVLKEWVMGRE
jgi:hypothetical protein